MQLNYPHEDFAEGTTIVADFIDSNFDAVKGVINGNIDADNIKDAAVTTDKIMAASVNNSKLSTTAGEVGGAWKSWTPTWTNLTPGNATVTGKYTQIGKTVHFKLHITWGSGTSCTNDPKFSLPVPPVEAVGHENIGGLIMYDATPATYYAGCSFRNGDMVQAIIYTQYSTTYLGISGISATLPVTWATNDKWTFTGTYEAA